MKKPLAIILLIIGAAAAWLVFIIGCALLWLVTWDNYGFFPAAVLTLAAAFGTDRLRILYRRKYSLKAPLFYLCAYAPAALWAADALITTVKRLDIRYDWFMAGIAEAYDKIFVPAETAAILLSALLWLVISTVINKRKVKLNESKN